MVLPQAGLHFSNDEKARCLHSTVLRRRLHLRWRFKRHDYLEWVALVRFITRFAIRLPTTADTPALYRGTCSVGANRTH
jgi:hypothetical protein